MKVVCSIFNDSNFKATKNADYPQSFEQLNVYYGYVLYETTIPDNISGPTELHVEKLHDRAIVLVDRVSINCSEMQMLK